MAAKPTGLTALKVKSAGPGMHADGGGLYLQVQGAGRSWVFRYSRNGKQRYMGLGSTSAITLAEAREAARDARRLLAQGTDPLDARNSQREAAEIEVKKTKAITFDQAAEQYITTHEASWRNPKHRQQWTNTLATYASPIIGKLPVAAIDRELVLRVIEPLWSTKTETANRVRGRIEAVLDWAKVRGYRDGDNPAQWRGNLAHALPAKSKVRRVQHHPALPYSDLPKFMRALRVREGIAARALEFTILTSARTEEVLRTRWDELDEAVWTIPASRMKASKPHRVPLSGAALAVLQSLPRLNEWVFPGARGPLSNMAMLNVLRRMGAGVTAHGFRSTFRDWAAECTAFPNHVVEQALAHSIGSAVEAAYRRGDLFDKRRELMTAWAAYCEGHRKQKDG